MNTQRSSLFRVFAFVLVFLVISSSYVWADDPHPSKPSSAVGDSNEKRGKDLRDSDHNKVLDDLDDRLATALDDDTIPVVLQFAQPISDVDFNALEEKLGDFDVQYTYPSINGVALNLKTRQVRAAALLGEVLQLEYDASLQADLDTAEAWFGVTKARADFGFTGNADGLPTYSRNDVVVAIVDTGIDAGHVDLDGGKVVCWRDFVNARTTPYDDRGHGTHVASIAAGEGQANPAYAGVAPGAALAGIKVLDDTGSGPTSVVMAGVQWAIDNKAACGIEVINLSLGSGGSSDGTDALSQMMNAAVSAGLVAVVAAGNNGPQAYSIGSPAASANAITVGSLADPGQGGTFLSYFSSRGPTADGRIKPDIVAPGHTIMAAMNGTGTGYTNKSGTSMATPFAAGVAALMLNANPTLSPAAVKATLMATTQDWGPSGPDPDYGAGRLDAYAAVKAAAGAASGVGPVVPGHSYYSGSLSGAGASVSYNINVTDAAYPIAATLIMPTWSAVNFNAYLYSPAGTQVGSAAGATRQETMTYRPSAIGVYRLEVRSSSGSGPYFLDVSAGTVPADAVPPAAPAGLAVAVPVSNGGSLNLGWNANTAPDLAGYNVYRGTTSGGPYQKVNSGLVATNAYASTGLTNGVTYFYVITAVDASGNESARSAQASGVPVDNKAPAISNVLAAPSSASAAISWNTDEPADSTVEYGTTSSLGVTAANASLVTGHNMSLTGLTNSTFYYYRVLSKDAAGNSSASVTQSFTTLVAPGSISGTVRDAATAAGLSGATVSDGTRSATTDASGNYSLSAVPAGTYTVTASRAGYTAASQSVTVVAGATSVANFSLNAAATTGTITGRVTNSSTGQPIAGARVTDGTRSTVTDANGYYTLANVPASSYRVTASATGYRTRGSTVTVSAGATVVVNFRLQRR